MAAWPHLRIAEEVPGGIGFGLFLCVLGAILTFAVDVDTSGLSVNTVGIILMVGGLLGLLLSALFGLASHPGAGAGLWPVGPSG
jgi:hypothetical protein